MEPTPSLACPFTFSQSSLQDYLDCPRRFQLRYIDQLHWPGVESEPILENERRQQEGELFHRLVQQHFLGLPDEKLERLANTPNVARWWANFRRASDLEMIGCTTYTELTLAVPLGQNRLVAKYDLVAVQPDGRAWIYDWKTYQKRPRDERMAARVQTRVYRSLLVRSGAALNGGKLFPPEAVTMDYWYADYPSEPARFSYDAVQYQRDWDGVSSQVDEICHHAHFPLTPDEKKCAYCPYRSYCNRGVEAGQLDEMEDTELSPVDLNYEQIAEIEY